jgi:hypothetical protein
MKADDSLSDYGMISASEVFVPLKVLHRFVGRLKRAVAEEPRSVEPFARFYPAAGLFSDKQY